MKAAIGKIYAFAKGAESGTISHRLAVELILRCLDELLKKNGPAR